MEKVNDITNKPAVKWYVTKARYSSLPYREKLEKSGMEFFLPTRFVIQDVAGRRLRVERPVIFNFIFIRGTVFEVKDFCRRNDGLSMVYRRRFHDEDMNNESHLLMTVSDKEMSLFAKTIGQYTEEVPFIRPSEVDLHKGDIVRILEGPFAGVEGELMSQQGKDGGRVLVSISNVIAVPTLEISPEYLQILSFASKGKHMYKKFDSFMPRARKALRHSCEGKLDSKDVVALTTFEKRFVELHTHTVNSQVKLLVYLLICYTCLKNEEARNKAEMELLALLPQVNSSTFKALALVNLYGCIRHDSYRRDAEKVIASWGEIGDKDKSKKEIAEDLIYFTQAII